MIGWGSSQIITDGLVLYLDAANQKSYIGSGTTWSDISGYRNNTTLIGPTYSEEGGGSFIFNGSTDYVQNGNTFNLPNWSYSFWYSTTQEVNSLGASFLRLSTTLQLYQSFGIFAGLRSITLDSNNNIFTGNFGNYEYRDEIRFCGQKINTDGSLNTDFNYNFIPGGAVSLQNVLIKSDDSVGYTAGTNLRTLSKFNTTTGEFLITNNVINSTLSNTVMFLDEPNNMIYLAGGFTSIGGVSYVRFARFNMDTLVVDSTFDTSVGFDGIPESSAIDSDGKIYVVGPFTTYKGVSCNRIARLNYDGSLDTTFITGTGFNDSRQLVVIIDSNNKPIITGRYTSYNGTPRGYIVRLNQDGTIDSSFSGVGFDSHVSDLKYDSVNQKLFCVGTFTAYNGTPRRYITSINLDGSVDTTFNVGGGFNSFMDRCTIQSDGKVIVGEGSINSNRTFTRTYNGYQFASFIRLNTDGSIDNTFDAGLGYTQGTYRNELYLRYKNSSGVATTLSNLGYFPGGGGRRQLSYFQDYYNNKWRFFTITKGVDDIYRVYADGVLVNTLTVPAGSDTSIQFNRVLNKGYQSNVMVYNRELTSQEVLNNYNVTKSRYGL